MSDGTHGAGHHDRWVYWGAWILLGVFAVIALISFGSARDNRRATEKAGDLIAVLEDAGAQNVPSQEQLARVLGDDGGAICDDPGNALRQATLYSMISNGATGPGMRPVIGDKRLVAGQLAVIEVYCPDELEDFKSYVDDLELDDVAEQ